MLVKILTTFKARIEPDAKPALFKRGEVTEVTDQYVDSLFDEGYICLPETTEPKKSAFEVAFEREMESAQIDFQAMTVAELKVYADDEGIDLSGASKKADIIEAIEASLAADE